MFSDPVQDGEIAGKRLGIMGSLTVLIAVSSV